MWGAAVEADAIGEQPPKRTKGEGSGHTRTFELSPGQNIDLANQKDWLLMTSWKRFFSRLQCFQRLDTANRCSIPCYMRVFDKS